jgi:hypothetical protein
MTDNSRRPRSAAASVPRILALDLMSKLGWACRARDGALMYGTEDFKLKGIESNELEECIEIVRAGGYLLCTSALLRRVPEGSTERLQMAGA